MFELRDPEVPDAAPPRLCPADRPFGTARGIVLAASDLFGDASLANDCARVYLTDFTGLSYIAQD